MKKIIGGRKYDTETATEMAKWDNEAYGSFRFWEIELYRKKTGEYFLTGFGGGVDLPINSWSDMERGEKLGDWLIVPITEAEAKQWTERHCDGDTYEEIFGEVEE